MKAVPHPSAEDNSWTKNWALDKYYKMNHETNGFKLVLFTQASELCNGKRNGEYLLGYYAVWL
jgi:hypothetical protein